MSDNPLRAGMPETQGAPPCAIVIFGASGDLTQRKLVPAIYNLALSRLVSGSMALIGVARRPKPRFAEEMKEAVAKHSRRKPIDEAVWGELAKKTSYVQGSFDDPETYRALGAELERVDSAWGTKQSRVFYLAVGPDQIETIVDGLTSSGLVTAPSDDPDAPFSRVVVEKPFGHDLESARALNRSLLSRLHERQVYRIDHYLGKETVQNLLVLRFGNAIFEPLWSRQHVASVQITVAEDIGVEGRGKFYEATGITRDIVQNHALQLLTLVGMEPPASWHADAVRDEKVKVLRALRPIVGPEVPRMTVRGQYAAGTVRGDHAVAYREEPDVDPGSMTETYVAMRMHVDNWRWGGVPFYLRSGKRLARRLAEVVLSFRPVPHRLFGPADASGNAHEHALVMRLQPDEGISLRFGTKVPGDGMAIRDVAMDFRYGAAFGSSSPEAYERLILDAMRGDATLFTRADEVEAQWRFIDPILAGWRGGADDDESRPKSPLRRYEAGSWGPEAADALLDAGHAWRRP